MARAGFPCDDLAGLSKHTDTEVVRRLYQALADHDLDAAGSCFAPDAVWVLPGRSPIAGRHEGWQAIRDEFLTKLAPLSGGTFRARLIDVAVGDEYVVAVQHATGEREGRHLDITGCQLMSVKDGLIVEVHGHYSDQEALDRFWT